MHQQSQQPSKSNILSKTKWHKVFPIFTDLVIPFLGIMLAYFAQYILDNNHETGLVWITRLTSNQRLLLSTGFYLLAIVLWIYFPSKNKQKLGKRHHSKTVSSSNLSNRKPQLFWLILSGVIYLLSILIFGIHGENTTVRILWILAIVIFLLSLSFTAKRSHEKIIGVGKSPPFSLENWLILGLILAFSMWLRSYQLAIIPDDFHGDMASHGIQARALLLGMEQNIFKFGWFDFPMFAFLPAFISMSIFGNNYIGLQMTSVIGGVVSIFAIYLLVWRLFDNHRLATITSVLVAINIPHIHFSRIVENMDPWPIGILALFFLVDGIRSKHWLSFGLSGILMGFSSIMYYSGRVIPIIVAFFFLYFLFNKKSWIYKKPKLILVLIMGFLLAVGSFAVHILLNLEPFLSRSSQVFLFNPGVMAHSLNKYNVDTVFKVILQQTENTLLMFNKVPDSSTQFGYWGPLFSSLLSPLLILGIGSAWRRRREPGIVLLAIWIGLMMILGSLLTVDAPAWPRLVGIIPAGALLAALAIDQAYKLLNIYLSQNGRRILLTFFILSIVYLGWINWDHYYQFVKSNASSQVFLGRYLQKLPEDVTICGFLEDPPLTVREIEFLAWPRKLVDFSPDATIMDLKNCEGSSLVWVLKPENDDRLLELYQLWPKGNLINYESNFNNFSFILYLTDETPPTLLPQAVMQKDLSSYKWMYFVMLAGLSLAGGIIWIGLKNKKALALRKKYSNLRFNKKYIDFDDREDRKKIKNLIQKIFLNSKIRIARSKLGCRIAILFDKISNFIGSIQFKKINKKVIWELITFLFPITLAYFGQIILNAGRNDAFTVELFRQIHLTENQRLVIVGVIFLISALLWILRIKPIQFFSKIKRETKKQNINSTIEVDYKNRNIKKLFLFDILLFMVISVITYIFQGENAFVRWMWIISLLGLISYLFIQRTHKEKWIVEKSPDFRNSDKWFLGTLIIIAFILRIYRLYDIPLDLSTDMASIGISARDYLLGNESQIFGTGWFYMPRLAFLPYVISMWLAGNGLFGLYFGTVIIGTLSLVAVYLLIWRLFDNHRLALLTTFLVTINPAHIEYSRIPSYIDPWLFGFFSLFFLIDGLKSRRNTSFAFSGMLAAFAFVSYPSGRAMIPLIGLVLLSSFLFRRERIKENYFGFVWLMGCFLFVLGPNLVYIINDWAIFMKRTDEVFVFSSLNFNHVRFSYDTNSIWIIIWEQIKRTLFSFTYFNDKSAQFTYPHPIFNPIIAPFMVLGFFQALWKWKQPEYLIIMSSFVFIMLTAGILTIDAPTWCRILPAIPLGAFFIAIVFEKILVFSSSFSTKLIPSLIMLLLVGFLIILGIKDWNHYINYVSVETRPVVFVGRFIDSLPDDIDVCGMTENYNVHWPEIDFLGWPRTLIEIQFDIPQITKGSCPGENLIWIVSPAYDSRLGEIVGIWPNGDMKKHYKYNGELLFISYLVTTPSLH